MPKKKSISKENKDDDEDDDDYSSNNKNMRLHVWITISRQDHAGHWAKVKNAIGDLLVKYNVARGHRMKVNVSNWSRIISAESDLLKEYQSVSQSVCSHTEEREKRHIREIKCEFLNSYTTKIFRNCCTYYYHMVVKLVLYYSSYIEKQHVRARLAYEYLMG